MKKQITYLIVLLGIALLTGCAMAKMERVEDGDNEISTQ